MSHTISDSSCSIEIIRQKNKRPEGGGEKSDRQTHRQTHKAQTGTKKQNWAHLRGPNILVKNVNARVFTNQCGRTDSGQRPILKPHLSDQCSFTRKTAPPPWQPYIYKTNLFTKFYDDWAKNVTSRIHVIQLTGTIFQLNSRIKKTNVLTKFHENRAKNVTSRVFTCFHYIHIEKNAPPTGDHVFSPIWTFFELVRHINKTNVLINFHDDGPKLFLFSHLKKTAGHLHKDLALNVTSTHDPFHADRTINVASRVITNKCGRTDDGQRPVIKAQLSKQETKVLTKFHENWAKNVTSRVLTCFQYIHIEKNALPTGRHVFSLIWTIFELVQEINKTNQKLKTAPPTGGHVFQRT
ncbi:hypothetical protein DPMN_136176 [Dreissena polymorpha]|uniref:Uncharacterized protein n=1 Tax=Dreissena polymorpha TaxID=45954 RepID=A0A9D4JGG4_DREPO|nr:hypothetical protein DPMN_136176 [Dreissena polymorpha]